MNEKYIFIYFYISNLYILEFQGELKYPLYFLIRFIILWENIKKYQNYIKDNNTLIIDYY
jgi:hypothetical protein